MQPKCNLVLRSKPKYNKNQGKGIFSKSQIPYFRKQKQTRNSTTMNKKNLLLVRSGRSSLHPAWKDERSPCRDFDIIALAYGMKEDKYPEGSHDHFYFCPGPKSSGYYSWINENRSIFEEYKYIALFDDDIYTTHTDISRIFEYCEALDISLAQPALTPDSHYSLIITRQHQSFLHRWTNFVEIMAPIFKSKILADCLETLP